MKTEDNSNDAPLVVNRHYSKKELCFLFGNISMYYLNRMIGEVPDLGDPLGRSYSAKQILMIINHYGLSGIFLKNQNKMH